MPIDHWLWLIRIAVKVLELILEHVSNGGDTAPLARVGKRWLWDPNSTHTLHDAIHELEHHPQTAQFAARLKQELPAPWLS